MSYPWMDSRWTDHEQVCVLCKRIIPVGVPRKYDCVNKVNGCVECVGALEMKDHYTPGAPAQPKSSPERESREAAIERMHGENYQAAKEIGEAVRSLKLSVIETNMILSELVRTIEGALK